MQHLKARLQAFRDTGAWTLILLGLILFVSRVPLATVWFINFPLAITIMQTAGLMFTIAGIQIFLSRLVWPGLSFSALIDGAVAEKQTGPALVLFGLFVYNGLGLLAFVTWLVSAMGAGLGA